MSSENPDNRAVIYQAQAETIIQNMKKRGIEGVYHVTAKEAVREICGRIPQDALVGLGGSETIIESGLVDALRGMDIRLLDRYREDIGKDEVDTMRRESLLSDIFISSSNALTADGRPVNIDGLGNRVAAMIYGPKKVILMVGMNKVVPTVDDAISRIKNLAAPINAIRVGASTPCATAGFCQEPHCSPPHRICGQLVITEASPIPGRLTVVLVGEDLGY